MRIIFCCLLLMTGIVATAQKTRPSVPDTLSHFLTVGDTVPDIALYNIVSPQSITRLKDIKRRITILAFWSATGIPSLQELPKVDSIRRRFEKSVRVLLVTRDGSLAHVREEAAEVIRRIEAYTEKKLPLTAVYIDTASTALFFNKVTEPHYIWLDRNKKIIAITDGDALTAGNMIALLSGKTLDLAVKPATGATGEPVQKHKAVLPR
ncbi:TlpA family protein disulfide reductase [Terrimonas rubra]|uniref:TlpA family protein disulfide reductase n=1 Tax=Terrimonas rubra TaxID=1035890 RepID=A0ABW6A6U7_9BACT